MLQYIYFSMLQYMFFNVVVHIFSMLQYIFFVVAVDIFRCCSACFSILQYIFFSMLQYIQPDVALHSFSYVFAVLQLKCYMLFWDGGAVGERGALGNGGRSALGSGGRACSILYYVPHGGRAWLSVAGKTGFRAGSAFCSMRGGVVACGGTLGRTRGASGHALEAGR
jgi:hypothetical protein